MKSIKWKSLMITCAVCLLPILLGMGLWNELPDTMAIHFNIYNQPDNFASKEFVVFGLPLLMALLQAFCCFINDMNAYKHGERKKFTKATKWIIPVMAMILQVLTLGIGLGWQIDVRRVAMLIVGTVLLVVGNYMPKLDYIKQYDVSTEKARKINRFLGIETVVMGLLAFITLLFPPVVSIAWLILFIPYVIIGILYGIKIGKSKERA